MPMYWYKGLYESGYEYLAILLTIEYSIHNYDTLLFSSPTTTPST